MKCKFCDQECTKAGRQKDGTQKFFCKACHKYQQAAYKYYGCYGNITSMVQSLVCEGVGIRSIGRVLNICNNTVLTRIREAAKSCRPPVIRNDAREFELDELRTYTGSRRHECWLAYCINRDSREVTAFTVGRRTKTQLQKITTHVLACNPRAVFTDRLPVYRSLLPATIHHAGDYATNRIERINLNLRTHLKRLSRKTICYSKSIELLEACIKIYFWGRSRR